jgi:hypothetical protein
MRSLYEVHEMTYVAGLALSVRVIQLENRWTDLNDICMDVAPINCNRVFQFSTIGNTTMVDETTYVFRFATRPDFVGIVLILGKLSRFYSVLCFWAKFNFYKT